MNEVSFEEEPQYRTHPAPVKQAYFVRLAIASGLAKSEKGAAYLLLGIAGVAVAIALMLLLSLNGKPKPHLPASEVQIRTIRMQNEFKRR